MRRRAARRRTPRRSPGCGSPGRAAAEVLQVVGAAVRPGITTDELDAIAHEECIKRGGYPSPLGYNGYPKSLCTSVNEVICHGIPDSTVLKDGDIVNCDVTIYLDGVHGDTNATFLVGEVDEESRRLVRGHPRVPRQGHRRGPAGRPGARHREGDPGARGAQRLRRGAGVRRSRDRPSSSTTSRRSTTTTTRLPASVLRGRHDVHHRADDQRSATGTTRCGTTSWTAVTVDRSRTAQFEHTLVVTDDGAEILTQVSGRRGRGGCRSPAPVPRRASSGSAR